MKKKTNTAAVVKFFHHQRTNKGRENAEDLSGREKCGALEASAIFPSCVISPVALCAKKYANKIVNGARHLPPAPFRPFQLLPLPHRMCLFVEDVSSLSQPKPLTSMSRRLKCLPIEIHRSAAFAALSFPMWVSCAGRQENIFFKSSFAHRNCKIEIKVFSGNSSFI